jgi:hypothetical protein
MLCEENSTDENSPCISCMISRFEDRYQILKVEAYIGMLQRWKMVLQMADETSENRSWQLCDINTKLVWLCERRDWITGEVAMLLSNAEVASKQHEQRGNNDLTSYFQKNEHAEQHAKDRQAEKNQGQAYKVKKARSSTSDVKTAREQRKRMEIARWYARHGR